MMSKLAVLVVVLALACNKEDAARQTAPQPDLTRNVVDSIFPAAEEIRRFKAARQGTSAVELENASSSRDALV